MVSIILQNIFFFCLLTQSVALNVTFRIIFNGNDYASCDTSNKVSTTNLDVVTPAYEWVLQDGDVTKNNESSTAYPTQLDLIGNFSTPTRNYTESALQSSQTDPEIDPYWFQYWHGPFQRYLNIGNYDNDNFKKDCSRVGRRFHLRRFGARSDSNFFAKMPCHVVCH